MIRYLLPLAVVSMVSAVPRLRYSAATPGQIQMAQEMGYDDTGPGAKDPAVNQAYHTYKTLDEALIAYLSDPDTKLPAHERNRAKELFNFLKGNGAEVNLNKDFHSSKNVHYNPHNILDKQIDLSPLRSGPLDFSVYQHLPNYQSPFRWQKLKEIWPNPLSIKHYTREPQFDSQVEPQVLYNEFPDNSAESAGVSDVTVGSQEDFPQSDSARGSPLLGNPSNPAESSPLSWNSNSLSGPLGNLYGTTENSQQHIPYHNTLEEASLIRGNPKNPIKGPLSLPYPNNSKDNTLLQNSNNLAGGVLGNHDLTGGSVPLLYPNNTKEGSHGSTTNPATTQQGNPSNNQLGGSQPLQRNAEQVWLWGPDDHRGHYTYWDKNGRLHVEYKDERRHKVYRLHYRRTSP